MTIEDYAIGVNTAVAYLKQFINYDHIQQDTQCLYYLTNLDYIPNELKKELIDKGIVYDFNIETNEGIELMMNSYNLLNMIADYNQSQIRKEENATPESIIDVSCLCYDEHDAKLVSDIHSNYFYAYNSYVCIYILWYKIMFRLSIQQALYILIYVHRHTHAFSLASFS